MTYWALLWKISLIGGLTIFSLMAIVVTIGGARDVYRLFARLNQEENDSLPANESEEG